MIKLYQKLDNDCLRAATASLLNLNINDVPNFYDYGKKEFWNKFIEFVENRNYRFEGFLDNVRIKFCESSNYYINKKIIKDEFKELKLFNGIDGFFIAVVYSPKYFNMFAKYQRTHCVVIDKKFNIINPIHKDYKTITKFPLHGLIGYNGIKSIVLVENK